MADYTGSLSFVSTPLSFSGKGVNIIYRMRAYSNISNNYIYWFSPNAPDPEGNFASEDSTNLLDVVIIKKENY